MTCNRQRRRRASLVVRRIPDEHGVLVTYLATAEAARTVGISKTTLSRWIRMGVVRWTDRLAGTRNVAVADVARLRMMSPAQSWALGIHRVPREHLRAMQEWHDQTQRETRIIADHHREEWDDYDVDFLLTSARKSLSLVATARALGRTYDSVTNKLDQLRTSGELPRKEPDDAWLERTFDLLTEDEVASLSSNS